MPDFVYTIGHSNHSIEKFVGLLATHDVTVVADVRSQPYSRYNPQFNREPLQSELKRAGLSYVFLGRELGARSEDPTCYVDGKAQYDLIAKTTAFREGLSRIARGVESDRVALMCAEKDPLTCHRAILICRQLETERIGARHILEDGRIETHDEAITRLLCELDLAENELFRGRDERILDAYEQRGQQIAYSQQDPAEDIAGRLPG